MMTPTRHGGLWVLSILALLLLTTGCGKNRNDGIEAVFIADFTTQGVGDNDSYPDKFLSPNASKMTVGVRSVKLIKADETDPSHTLFEAPDSAHPIVLDLTSTAQSVAINEVFPTGCPCEFSKVQVELTYVEVQVPVYDNGAAVDRRFRFYTLDLTDPDLGTAVKAGEVLVGNTTNNPLFSWIDTDNGTFEAITGTRPLVPLMVPATRFPEDQYTSTVTIDLPAFFTVSDKQKGILTVTLTVHAGEIFFYDETDTAAPENTRFDIATDGKLNGINPNSHYYPVFPALTASGP